MDVNCNTVKTDPYKDHHLTNHRNNHQHQQHAPTSDWSDAGDFDSVYDKHQYENTASSSIIPNNNVHGLSNYSTCVTSLDTSSGLNGAYSALDLNNSNHLVQQQQPPSFSTCVDSNRSTHSNRQQQSQIEYLSSSSSQSISPIRMEDQEQAKLDRKRQRNRLAASLCRKRKLEKISKLESRVELVKTENSELIASIAKYKEQLEDLRAELNNHARNGCNIPQSFQMIS